jgi:hypothetical protein
MADEAELAKVLEQKRDLWTQVFPTRVFSGVLAAAIPAGTPLAAVRPALAALRPLGYATVEVVEVRPTERWPSRTQGDIAYLARGCRFLHMASSYEDTSVDDGAMWVVHLRTEGRDKYVTASNVFPETLTSVARFVAGLVDRRPEVARAAEPALLGNEHGDRLQRDASQYALEVPLARPRSGLASHRLRSGGATFDSFSRARPSRTATRRYPRAPCSLTGPPS